MKKILLGLVLLIFVLSACVSPTPTEPPVKPTKAPKAEVVEEVKEEGAFRKAQNGRPFRFAQFMQQHPVMKLMSEGFLQACEDFDVLCVIEGFDGDDDSLVVSSLERMTAEDTSGATIGLWYPARFEAAKIAIEQGVPVVGVHAPIDRENVPTLLAWSAPDVAGFSGAAGKALAEEVACQGPIAVSQTDLNEMQNEVQAVFREKLLEECPDIEILEMAVMGLDLPVSISLAVGVFQAHPDITGAFSSDGNGGIYWSEGAREAGLDPNDVAIIGMDYTRPNLDLVASGDVWMLVGQPLYEENYFAVALLVSNLMGLPVPYENHMPAPLITLENIDQFYAINDAAEARGE